MKNQTSGRGTTLTCCTGTGKDRGTDNHVQISIISNNDGIVATQFQQGLSESGLNFDANL